MWMQSLELLSLDRDEDPCLKLIGEAEEMRRLTIVSGNLEDRTARAREWLGNQEEEVKVMADEVKEKVEHMIYKKATEVNKVTELMEIARD